MYESYWKLHGKPFVEGYTPERFFAGDAHQAALYKLRYAVEQSHALATLIGPTGCGKTLILRALAAELSDSLRPVVHIVYPVLTATELLHWIAEELYTLDVTEEPRPAPGQDVSLRRILNRSRECVAEQRRPVILIDEAHLLEDDAWRAIRLLANLTIEEEPALSIIISGQEPVADVLQEHPDLDDRCGSKGTVEALSLEETRKYILHLLGAVGGDGGIFQPKAIDALYYLSQGVPRRMNRLADLALLVGFADGLKSIDAGRIESVSQELSCCATPAS